MTPDQKRQARDAIRLWAQGDPEQGSQENPLAARHRFTEQVGGSSKAVTVRATQTRQSGGSQPVTYAMNSFELKRMDRIMEVVADQDANLLPILKEWGKGSTFEEIADKREYAKSKAHERFTLGMNLVYLMLAMSDQGMLHISGLRVRNKRA